MIKVNVFFADTIGLPVTHAEIIRACREAMPRYSLGEFTVMDEPIDPISPGVAMRRYTVCISGLKLAFVHPFGHLLLVREIAGTYPQSSHTSKLFRSALRHKAARLPATSDWNSRQRHIAIALRTVALLILGDRPHNSRSLRPKDNRVFLARGARYYSQYIEDRALPDVKNEVIPIHLWDHVTYGRVVPQCFEQYAAQEVRLGIFATYNDPVFGPEHARAKNESSWQRFLNLLTDESGEIPQSFADKLDLVRRLGEIGVGVTLSAGMLAMHSPEHTDMDTVCAVMYALNYQRAQDGDPYITATTFSRTFPDGILPTGKSMVAYVNQLPDADALRNVHSGIWARGPLSA